MYQNGLIIMNSDDFIKKVESALDYVEFSVMNKSPNLHSGPECDVNQPV